MTPFEYRRAGAVADAVAWLREDPDAKLLAGGQSLLAAMKLGLAAPTVLIDLGRLPELRALREENGTLWIGAMCTHATVAASPLVRAKLPGLARLAGGSSPPTWTTPTAGPAATTADDTRRRTHYPGNARRHGRRYPAQRLDGERGRDCYQSRHPRR